MRRNTARPGDRRHSENRTYSSPHRTGYNNPNQASEMDDDQDDYESAFDEGYQQGYDDALNNDYGSDSYSQRQSYNSQYDDRDYQEENMSRGGPYSRNNAGRWENRSGNRQRGNQHSDRDHYGRTLPRDYEESYDGRTDRENQNFRHSDSNRGRSSGSTSSARARTRGGFGSRSH